MTERGGPPESGPRAQLPRSRRPGPSPLPTSQQPEAPSRHAARESRAHEVRRALLLTTLSAILPGLGLTLTRKRRIGLYLLGGFALIVMILLWVLLRHGVVRGAAALVSTGGLYFLLFGCLVGGLLWLGGILLTYVETSGRRWPHQTKWMHRIFTVLLCMAVGVPAAIASNYVLITKQTTDTVFTGRYNGRDAGQRGPVSGSDPWRTSPRINMLFLGSDAGADRTGVRTDSIMVASVDTKTGDTTLISIPRNLERVPIPATNPLHKIYPNGFYCPTRGTGHDCLMDAIWTEADTNHPELFPKDEKNPGLDTTREVASAIVGMPIDYTVVIDLAGFQKLVDAMGGVSMNVPKGGIAIGGRIINGRIIPGSITGRIPAGYRKLDGREALWYSRSRVESDDDDRTRRQRCMVNALIDQANPFSMVTKFSAIMAVARQSISTDVPQDRLDAFATLVTRMKKGNISSVNLSSKVIAHGDPDYAKIKSLVKTAINRPHTKKKSAPKTSKAPSSSSSPSSSAPTKTIENTADSC